jgi:steroid delta-isomerase-like uncharacterized protein
VNPEAMVKLFDAHMDAVNRHDADAVAAGFHEDGFYESVPLWLTFKGRQGITLFYASIFNTFPDFRVEIEGRLVGEGCIGSYSKFTGTMEGEFMNIAPTGRKVEVPLATFHGFGNGAQLWERNFFDLVTLCNQAGVGVYEVVHAASELRD